MSEDVTMTRSSLLSVITGHLRSGDWATPSRVRGYMLLLAFANILGFSLAICRAHGWYLPQEAHISTEFMGFYAAGRLVDAGQGLLAYMPAMPVAAYIHSLTDPPAVDAMQKAISHDPQLLVFSFLYPPVFWLICAPLALLGFYTAYFLWVSVTVAAGLGALRQLLGSWRLVWPVLAYYSAVKSAVVGENAVLSAGLIGFGLLNLQRRPLLAGLIFGCLCYKPHFILPIGIFLTAGLQWRALCGMTISGGALCGLAVIIFGWQPWLDYFQVTVPHAEWMIQHHGYSYGVEVTPFSAVRMLGGSITSGNIIQAVASIFAAGTLACAARWARPNIQSAVLAACFPVILSVMMDYDLTICGLAVVFLYREARETGFLPWEKTILAAMFTLPLATLVFRTGLHFPMDQIIVLVFLSLMLVRIFIVRSQRFNDMVIA